MGQLVVTWMDRTPLSEPELRKLQSQALTVILTGKHSIMLHTADGRPVLIQSADRWRRLTGAIIRETSALGPDASSSRD